ncbi:MAG: chemotaxis protein CheR, partial [Deltaproteobacteria bacterium]|nr:chemotaxis protein CheR [Deltaproteobacteria bacterium]
MLLSAQDHSRGINLPIDVFFRSLADDQAEKAVGIILSGTGSDGMRGIRAIKEAGGMVMVQSEESAKFDGMPRSAISTGLADFINPPADMPQQLLAFAEHPYISKTERSDALVAGDDDMAKIFSLLRERHKIDFTYYKPSTVLRRLERRMTVNHIVELSEYIKFLDSYPREVSTLYRELLIGVTNFFRDREAFEILGENLLPAMFKKNTENGFRFWVTGCSTGEEAYSLAILARECMEQSGREVDLKIFATDVDRDAVVQAGNGIYPESIAADLSPNLLAKYFQR